MEFFVSTIINGLQPSKKVAIDVGANHGIYTELLAKKFDQVLAVEAHPDNVQILKERFKDTPNVKVIPMAINKTNDPVTLNVNVLNPGGHSINNKVATHPEWGFTETVKLEIPGITLDELTKDLDVEFIKMDIEGAEDFVFEGATELLKKKLNIMIEVHKEVDLEKLYKTFTDNKFQVHALGIVLSSNETRYETCMMGGLEEDQHYYLIKP